MAGQTKRGATLSEIANALDLSPATCYAIASVLTDQQYLLRSPIDKSYALGPALLAIGNAAERALPIVRMAKMRLAEVASIHRVEATAATVQGGEITIVDWIAPPEGQSATARVGQKIPMRPPFGAVHAAWAPSPVIDQWFADAPASAHADLGRLLDTIRKRGFDVHRNDHRAAAVRDALVELDPEGLSAPAQRAIELLLAELAGVEPLPIRFKPEQRYDVNTISTTVRDTAGQPLLSLSLLFHRQLTGKEIEAAGADLLSAWASTTDPRT